MTPDQVRRLEELTQLKMNPAFQDLIKEFKFIFVDIVIERIANENDPKMLGLLAAELRIAKNLLKIFQDKPSEAEQRLEDLKNSLKSVDENKISEYGV